MLASRTDPTRRPLERSRSSRLISKVAIRAPGQSSMRISIQRGVSLRHVVAAARNRVVLRRLAKYLVLDGLRRAERAEDSDQQPLLVGGQEVQARAGVDDRARAHPESSAAGASVARRSMSSASRSTWASGRSAGSAQATGCSTGSRPPLRVLPRQWRGAWRAARRWLGCQLRCAERHPVALGGLVDVARLLQGDRGDLR